MFYFWFYLAALVYCMGHDTAHYFDVGWLLRLPLDGDHTESSLWWDVCSWFPKFYLQVAIVIGFLISLLANIGSLERISHPSTFSCDICNTCNMCHSYDISNSCDMKLY